MKIHIIIWILNVTPYFVVCYISCNSWHVISYTLCINVGYPAQNKNRWNRTGFSQRLLRSTMQHKVMFIKCCRYFSMKMKAKELWNFCIDNVIYIVIRALWREIRLFVTWQVIEYGTVHILLESSFVSEKFFINQERSITDENKTTWMFNCILIEKKICLYVCLISTILCQNG